jgi:hypothetical protein
MGRRLRRHQTHGGSQLGDRFSRTAEGQQTRSGEQACRPERSVQLNRAAEFRERLLVPTPLLQHDAKVVVDETLGATAPQDIAEGRLGSIKLPALQRGHALGESVGNRMREILGRRGGRCQ